MEQKQIAQLMTIIANNYQQQLSKLDGNAFFNNLIMFLSDQDYTLVANNLKKHILTSKYLPTIADLVKDDTIYSSVPSVEETRLMIAEREKERENHVPSNPEYVKKLIAETKAKLMEAQLNELERDYKRACELRSRE